MASRVHPIFLNFNAGELSPKLEGRVDLTKYFSGVNTMRNFICLPQGGVESRSGTHFVAETKDSNRKSGLIPFKFAELQNYMLEFGHEYIRFYMNSGQIWTVDSYTKLLIHCNGTEGSTEFEDGSPSEHTVTPAGYAKVNTSNKKFGTGSCTFYSGPGSYLYIPDHADWNFGTGRFTIDFWYYPMVTPTAGNPIGLLEQWETDEKFFMLEWTTTSLKFHIPAGNIEYAWDPDPYEKWFHIAIIRGWGDLDNQWAICIDGQAVVTKTIAGTMPDVTANLEIGRARKVPEPGGGPEMWYANGLKDEIRISKGIARWMEDFNPPSVEYPLGSGNEVYEISSPYSEADLPYIRIEQNDEEMILMHPDYAQRKLIRLAHDSWILKKIEFTDGPYDEENTATIVPSGTTGVITLAVSSGTEKYLLYDNEVAAFTVDDTVTGTTSGATAKIVAATDWGASGILTLANIVGTFQDNEQITDAHTGDALVNGKVGDTYVTYDNEAGGPFEIDEIIYGYGFNMAYLRGLQDDGDTGKMVLDMAYGEFSPDEALRGDTSEATCDAVAISTAIGPVFASGDVDRLMRLYISAAWYWVRIVEVTDSYNAKVLIKGEDLPVANATKYRMGSWGGENGYPRTGCFHGGRMLYGSNYEWPRKIWGSVTREYDDFTEGTEDDDAYTFEAADIDIIKWIKATRRLCIGGASDEATATGPNNTLITPTDPPVINGETPHGSSSLVGILKIGKAIMFLQKSGKKIREFTYSYVDDAYSAPDITQLAEHLFQSGIVAMAYQEEPNSIIWAVTSTGVLLGCTYDRAQDVVGWHQHTTDGEFESVAVIPYQNQDQVWVIVKREIDGNVKRYVEYLDPNINVDCGLTYSGAPIRTLAGLTHLEGKTVKIVGDGAVYLDDIVADGTVTIDEPYPAPSEIYVGLSFTPTLITNRPEVNIAGTSQGLKKKWNRVIIRMLETMGLAVNGNIIIPARMGGMDMDAAPTPFSGDKPVTCSGWGSDARITIQQLLPLKASITCITGSLSIGDD